MIVRRQLFACLVTIACSAAAASADPIVIELPEQARARSIVVSLGDVARISGGDPAVRGQIAQLDVAEMRSRDQSLSLTRRAIEFRLKLAGIDTSTVAFGGSERVTIVSIRRAITVEEVVNSARAELSRRLSAPQEEVTVELIQPVVIRLPEIPEAERVTIVAQPHGRVAVGFGRVQMDVTIYAGSEKLLGLPLYMEVRAAARTGSGPTTVPISTNPVVPSAMSQPLPTPGLRPLITGEILVRSRQRVKMVVHLGTVDVTAIGEAQQDGRLNQSIMLQNVDSKKTVTGRVVGPSMVEIDQGGSP